MLTQWRYQRTAAKSKAAGNTLARLAPSLLASYVAGQPSRDLGATFTRASTATYPDASAVTQTAAINVLRDSAYYGGNRTVLLEGSRTNHFLNSAAPVTQTSGSLATGTYTLWITGTGSVAVAGTTATITGAGTATAGTPVTFTVTVAGTVTYTVTGSPTTVQAEDGAFASSYIPTVGASVTRSADNFAVAFQAPPTALTLYTKFVERGTITSAPASRILNISAAANPQLDLGTSGTAYRIRHHNGTTQVQSQAAASPAIGDVVELRAILNADGSVQLGQSINGAAEVVAAVSAVNTLAAAWGNTTLNLNSNGALTPGFTAFSVPYKVAPGVLSLSDMRNR